MQSHQPLPVLSQEQVLSSWGQSEKNPGARISCVFPDLGIIWQLTQTFLPRPPPYPPLCFQPLFNSAARVSFLRVQAWEVEMRQCMERAPSRAASLTASLQSLLSLPRSFPPLRSMHQQSTSSWPPTQCSVLHSLPAQEGPLADSWVRGWALFSRHLAPHALVPTHRHHDSHEEPALVGGADLCGAPHPARPAAGGGHPAGGGCPAVPTEGLWRHL